MRVAITARLRNGPLWEAAEKLGGIKRLSEYLGVCYQTVISWVNFKVVPDPESDKARLNYAGIEAKLVALNGTLLEDVFPKELRGRCDTKEYRLRMERLSRSRLLVGKNCKHDFSDAGERCGTCRQLTRPVIEIDAGPTIEEAIVSRDAREKIGGK